MGKNIFKKIQMAMYMKVHKIFSIIIIGKSKSESQYNFLSTWMVIIRQTDLSSIKQNVKKVESLYITPES